MNETCNVLLTKSEFSFISPLHVPSTQHHLWIPKNQTIINQPLEFMQQ